MPAQREFVTLVSGLERSGTSMMMQMLEAGGVPVAMDSQFPTDRARIDNPRGYYEYQPHIALLERGETTWLHEKYGQAVKIALRLTDVIPRDCPCRWIFMRRNLEEVLASQILMAEHAGRPIANALSIEEWPRLRASYQQQIHMKLQHLLAVFGTDGVLVMEYGDIVSNPHHWAAEIDRHLGGGLSVNGMAQAVDPSLYRLVAADT